MMTIIFLIKKTDACDCKKINDSGVRNAGVRNALVQLGEKQQKVLDHPLRAPG